MKNFRQFIKEEKDFPSVKCFNSALDFLKINKDKDDWFLQLETFDPHEPFFAPQRFREKFKTNYRGPRLDWPQYDKVKETDDEVAEKHIPNAKQMDIQNPPKFMEELQKLDASKNYYVYCRSGSRSAQACAILKSQGFENCYNLLGGITEWEGETVS